MICPFCKGPVAWESRGCDFNDGGMNPVSRRTLACRNPECLIKPSAGYEDHVYVFAADCEPGESQGYRKVERDTEFEAAWAASSG